MPAEINSTAACQQLYDLTPSFYAAVKKNDEKVSGVSIRLISESKTAFRERSNVFVRIWKWIARHIWTKEVKFTVGGAQLPIKLYDERSNIAAVRRLFWFALQGVTKVSDGDKQKLLQVMRFALKSDNIVDKQEGDTSCHDLFLAYLKGEDSDLVGPSIPLDKDKGVGDTFIACAQSFKGEKVSNEVFQRLCASFSIIKEELSEEQNGEIIRMLDEILSGQIDVTTNVAETVTTVVEGLRSMREGGITPAQPSLEKTGASILRSIGHFEVSQKDFPEFNRLFKEVGPYLLPEQKREFAARCGVLLCSQTQGEDPVEILKSCGRGMRAFGGESTSIPFIARDFSPIVHALSDGWGGVCDTLVQGDSLHIKGVQSVDEVKTIRETILGGDSPLVLFRNEIDLLKEVCPEAAKELFLQHICTSLGRAFIPIDQKILRQLLQTIGPAIEHLGVHEVKQREAARVVLRNIEEILISSSEMANFDSAAQVRQDRCIQEIEALLKILKNPKPQNEKAKKESSSHEPMGVQSLQDEAMSEIVGEGEPIGIVGKEKAFSVFVRIFAATTTILNNVATGMAVQYMWGGAPIRSPDFATISIASSLVTAGVHVVVTPTVDRLCDGIPYVGQSLKTAWRIGVGTGAVAISAKAVEWVNTTSVMPISVTGKDGERVSVYPVANKTDAVARHVVSEEVCALPSKTGVASQDVGHRWSEMKDEYLAASPAETMAIFDEKTRGLGYPAEPLLTSSAVIQKLVDVSSLPYSTGIVEPVAHYSLKQSVGATVASVNPLQELSRGNSIWTMSLSEWAGELKKVAALVGMGGGKVALGLSSAATSIGGTGVFQGASVLSEGALGSSVKDVGTKIFG